MPAALAPSALSRSGASTLSTPEAIAGSATSHMPIAIAGRASASSSRAGPGWGGGGEGAGSRATATASAPATTTTAENTGARPSACASVPITGPNSAPPIAAASAPPIVLAAALGGDLADQPGEAARPRAGAAEALDETRGVEQHDVVEEPEREARAPHQEQAGVDRRARPRPAASMPPGIEPTSVPAAYPAVSTPADAFDRWSSRVSVGSSGTTAA